MMGNSGASTPPAPPPPEPVPIEDDLSAKREAAKLSAMKGSSRESDDLGRDSTTDEAVTRGQLAKAEVLKPQAQPRGPAKGAKSPRGPRPGIATSAVITG